MADHIAASVEGDIARMEGEGPTFCADDIEEARYAAGLTTPEPDHEQYELGLKIPRVPLAPPARPLMLGDTTVRIALIQKHNPSKPLAMELDFAGEEAILQQSKLIEGHMEIALTNGFGASRTIQLSPAEFMLIMMYGDRFFAELPRS